MSRMSFKKCIEILVCAWIVVHMVVICVIPLPNTIFYHSMPQFILKYANQLGIHNSWNMFAPDPSPEIKMRLAYFKDQKQTQPQQLIEHPKGKLYGLSAIREFYMVNYFLASDERIFREMEPVLCANLSQGYWSLKTWGKFDRKNFGLSRDMVLDCEKD